MNAIRSRPTPQEKRDLLRRMGALMAISLIAFMIVQFPFVALVRMICGTAPESIRAIPGYATAVMFGMSFAYRGDIGLGVFLKSLRVQGIAAVAGLALAMSMQFTLSL